MEVARAWAARIDAVRVLRQAAVLVGGSLLLAIGLVMVFLPGPGLAVIVGALAILATEFAWARRFLDRGRALVDTVRAGVRARLLRFSPTAAVSR